MLVSAVPRDAVVEAIAMCGVRERRSDGKLPAHVTAYLTLGLALFPDDDYEEVALSHWFVGPFRLLGCVVVGADGERGHAGPCTPRA